jgi:hypothetical protein
MADQHDVLQQFARQAASCEAMGSPFTAQLCRVLAAHLDRSNAFGRRILDWDGDPFDDNVALRACGALHALARGGREPDLAAVYPPHTTTGHALWVVLAELLTRNAVTLSLRLSSPPQTNEVARSGILLGAMLRIAEITRQPLEVYEVGASAGLNLGFDQYAYALGNGRAWGSSRAPLTIETAWRGRLPPLDVPLSVVGRHGCDLNPVDPSNRDDCQRLLSYIWADQVHRLARVEAALALAAAEHRRVEQADAADWLPRMLEIPQPTGVTRVVFHTVVWQYLPAARREAIEAVLARTGAAATRTRPFAHLAVEGDGQPEARIDLTVWPPGETMVLGRADFHGRWVDWA